GAENRTDSPLRNRGSQFSVLTSENIVTTHLATAITSSVSGCSPDGVILSSESTRSPSHGFCRDHWALSRKADSLSWRTGSQFSV
ncbi:MAG: hypothetical protein VX759_09140, partial [SAR324 cluster bacterium]|nr:hypothetical protein [SAR324 cluster bacterium]